MLPCHVVLLTSPPRQPRDEVPGRAPELLARDALAGVIGRREAPAARPRCARGGGGIVAERTNSASAAPARCTARAASRC